jgi:hypothetical protein
LVAIGRLVLRFFALAMMPPWMSSGVSKKEICFIAREYTPTFRIGGFRDFSEDFTCGKTVVKLSNPQA